MLRRMLVALATLSPVLLYGCACADEGQQPLLSGDTSAMSREVIAKFQEASIIPEVVDLFEPRYLLLAKWTNTSSARLGNSLSPASVQERPASLQLGDPQDLLDMTIDAPTNAVFILTDPDARSRQDPDWSEVCHWIMYVWGTGVGKKVIETMPYKAPAPPPKTGAHRYVMLALTPANGTTDMLDLDAPADRKHWGYSGIRVGARRWAEENGLEPMAGNFFYAQNVEQ